MSGSHPRAVDTTNLALRRVNLDWMYWHKLSRGPVSACARLTIREGDLREESTSVCGGFSALPAGEPASVHSKAIPCRTIACLDARTTGSDSARDTRRVPVVPTVLYALLLELGGETGEWIIGR
ncbi:hypothetical protein C8J57DRAFT_1212671 [Mycena rebaudengoi]|nr:hypothetical protein C8J57DRAFT_1212671 [Mycena rebaudengoi]